MEELEKLRKYRRDLHQIPELELDLPQTREYVINVLKDLDCHLIDLGHSSVAAFFDAGQKQTMAFRSDMDALPIKEACEVDYASRHEGRMHACGHDGHMALLLTFAGLVNDCYRELDHNVLLIFQAGEETPGGARLVCETGALDKLNVDQIYGTHLWPHLPAGTVATRPGPLMARSSEVNIDIYGKSAHVARYAEGIDAVEIGAKLLLKLYDEESRLPDSVYRLLRFGSFHGGSVRNAVANGCHIEGTLRAFEEEVYWFLRNTIEVKAGELAEETGAKINLSFSDGYPAVINDPQLVRRAMELNPQLGLLNQPEMISEDFSYYQQEVPGVFFFLGTGTGIELHNDHFDFDEACLLAGLANYEALLNRPQPEEEIEEFAEEEIPAEPAAPAPKKYRLKINRR